MKSVKIRIEFNNKQKTFAMQHCGVARHAWNYSLDICKNIELSNKDLPKDKKVKLPSAIDLHKIIVKDVKSKFSWYYDVSKFSAQQSTRNLQTAYKRYFDELKNGNILKKKNAYISKRKSKGLPIDYAFLNDIGKPKFKKKGQKDSFYLESPQKIKVNGNKIQLPKIGWVKCSEELPDCEIKNCVVSRTADEWFVSFKIPFITKVTEKQFEVVGVDLGISALATLSTGVTFENRKPYRTYRRKLKLAQQQVSKKYVKGAKSQSNNYKKACLKVAKIHQHIANIRKDSIHKLTSYLVKNHSEIVIEDLNVSGMTKNHKLASTILDCGFFEFRRQLDYKCKWYGSKLTVVDRFFPSSKTCSRCNHVKKQLKLSEREYVCEECALVIGRDLNASINLRNKSVSYTESACGVSNKRFSITDEDTMKQETNINHGNIQDCISFV